MNYLDLFSGIGGFALGAYWAGMKFERHYFSEIDPYCVKLYQQRFPDAVALGDITKIKSEDLPDGEWIITGGFPCQPFSYEGKRKKEHDTRNMWPATNRIISEIRPYAVLLENVLGIRDYLPVVIRDLRRNGYIVESPIIASAGSAGALHIRNRVWIFAHTFSERRMWEWNPLPKATWERPQTWYEFERLVQDVLRSCVPARKGSGIHDGVPARVDRLRGLGNAIVPQIAEILFRRIMSV